MKKLKEFLVTIDVNVYKLERSKDVHFETTHVEVLIVEFFQKLKVKSRVFFGVVDFFNESENVLEYLETKFFFLALIEEKLIRRLQYYF